VGATRAEPRKWSSLDVEPVEIGVRGRNARSRRDSRRERPRTAWGVVGVGQGHRGPGPGRVRPIEIPYFCTKEI
jgi:hypothetical protein